jgi:hypothetical protein
LWRIPASNEQPDAPDQPIKIMRHQVEKSGFFRMCGTFTRCRRTNAVTGTAEFQIAETLKLLNNNWTDQLRVAG